MSEELKPCPFCGGEAREVPWTIGRQIAIGCERNKCFVGPRTAYHEKVESSIKAWNTRPNTNLTAQNELIEKESKKSYEIGEVILKTIEELEDGNIPSDDQLICILESFHSEITKVSNALQELTDFEKDQGK